MSTAADPNTSDGLVGASVVDDTVDTCDPLGGPVDTPRSNSPMNEP